MSFFDSIKSVFHSSPASPQLRQSSLPKSDEANSSSQPNHPGSASGKEHTPANQAGDRRVLFIVRDPHWFQLVERDIHIIQPNWSCQQVGNVAEARMALAGPVSFNAVILDSQLAEGAKLLTQIEQKRRVTCLVRDNTSSQVASDQWKDSNVTRISGNADAALLISSIIRNERLRDWMTDQSIKKLLAQVKKLPIVPEIYMQVTDHLQSANGSMVTVARLISQDPVMSAKILQVVNSAYFGLAHEVADTAQAVMVLGAERIKSLILLSGIFSQYANLQCPSFSPEKIWGHSLQVGLLARTIAYVETKDAVSAETAFTAGLLHDVGKLILAANLPHLYEMVQQSQSSGQISPNEAEKGVMGATHAEFGACLLATWGLSLPILEAIAWHQEPQKTTDKGFSTLAAVHVANAFAHELADGSKLVNLEFLSRAELGDCYPRWRKCCGLPENPAEQLLNS